MIHLFLVFAKPQQGATLLFSSSHTSLAGYVPCDSVPIGHSSLLAGLGCLPRGELLALYRNRNILGVILDPHLDFSPHMKDFTKRARSWLNIMGALAGVSWGRSKEALLTT